MTRPLAVIDASAAVAILVDPGATGSWIRQRVGNTNLHAPALMPYEVQNVLRRLERARTLSRDNGTLANRDLGSLPASVWPHEATMARTWELRHNLNAYDAAYVALAELLDCPLLTADQAIGSAPDINCEVEVIPVA